MNRNQAILSVVVTSVLGLACGVGLGMLAGGGGEVASDGLIKGGRLSGSETRARLTALGRGTGARGAARDLVSLVQSSEIGLYEKFCGYVRVVSGAEAEEMPSLIERLQRDLPEEVGRDVFVKMAIGRWVELDPGGALDAFLAGRPKGLGGAVDVIVKAAVEREPRAVWERLLEAANDPQNGALGSSAMRGEVIGAALKGLYTADPAFALGVLGAGDFSPEVQAGVVVGLTEIARDEPGAVLDMFERKAAFLKGADTLLTVAFASMAGADSEQALFRLVGLDPSMRSYALNGIAAGWAKSDPEAAFSWASGLTGGTGNGVTASVLREWGKNSPAGAAAVLAAVDSPQVRKQVARAVVDSWADSDRSAAFEWAKGELEGETQVGAYSAILSRGVEDDFDGNFEMYKEMVEAMNGADWAERNFASKWARKDARAAVDWAAGLEGGGRALVETAFEVWASSDLAAARSYAAQVEDEGVRSMVDHVLEGKGGSR